MKRYVHQRIKHEYCLAGERNASFSSFRKHKSKGWNWYKPITNKTNILAINKCSEIAQYDNIPLWRCSANILIWANIGFGTVSAPFQPFFWPNSTHLTWVVWTLHDDFCHVGSKPDVKCRFCRYRHSYEKDAIEATQMFTLGVTNRLKCAQMHPNLPCPNISINIGNNPIFDEGKYRQ